MFPTSFPEIVKPTTTPLEHIVCVVVVVVVVVVVCVCVFCFFFGGGRFM